MAADGSARGPAHGLDAALTAVVVVIGVVDTWIKPSNGLLTGAPTPVVAAVSGAVGAVLWWRRRRPRTVCVAVMAGYLTAFTPVALAVALYTVGDAAHRATRVLVLYGLAGCAVGLGALAADHAPIDPREAGYVLALILGPLVVGSAVGMRRDLVAAARAEVAGLERERNLVVERAQAEERARIAREMHDVVAHRVGNIVLTASALKVGPLARAEPAVGDAAEQIRAEGHHALEELREILGVLAPSRGGRRAPRTPQPDALQLSQLVEHANARGQRARLAVNGHPEVLPTQVQRALYRIVQETLTNAAKYAPGSEVTVTVDCRLDRIRMAVTNGPATRPLPLGLPPSGGNGLIGLTERVTLLGGTLAYGPHQDGFQVRADIPHPPRTGHGGPGLEAAP
ncbi:sensor histidine kinase [Streptomyces sp. NPDC001339]|uniref:sensor histidine kinase n=1 Tax=Streptomyces sp. NPDC001339 TaxID=3364563 RepID=UPI0036A4439D